MTVYVALLRGVNVGGNTLKMERLRELSGELDLEEPRTYLQSGNLVFKARGAAAHWTKALERKLLGASRLPVTVIARSGAKLGKIVEANPFPREKGIDLARLHVSFVSQGPSRAGLDKLSAIPAGADRFRALGSEIYLHCPNGYGISKLSNTAIEKALALRATTRNWNTVRELHEMCGA